MARRVIRDPVNTMNRRLSEGRGKGHGPDYQPYLKVRDVPSKGFSTRVKGWKTSRIHHLLSNLELYYFYHLEWLSEVVDIREQYPLPLEHTLEIASQLHVKHPTDPRSKKPMVMTTDFIVDMQTDDGVISVARSIKPHEKLNSSRVIEKLELERMFWREFGVAWGLVTELEIPLALAKNVEILHLARDRESFPGLSAQIIEAVEQILFDQTCRCESSFAECAVQADLRLGLEAGTSLSIAKHLIANKVWLVDMSLPLNFSRILPVTRNERKSGVWTTAA